MMGCEASMVKKVTKKKDSDFEHLLSQVVSFAKDIVLITEAKPIDPPGPRIVYVNKAFEDLTGYLKKNVIGLTPRILQGENTSKNTKAIIKKQLKKQKSVHVPIINYTKRGKKYWIDMTIVPLRDKNSKVTHFAAIERDISFEKGLEHRLKALANQDPLTKLLNRGAFLPILNRAFIKFHKNKNPFSILLLDIDDFKKINDKYGHLIGDKILIWISTKFTEILRKTDVIARYGGEEFIAYLPNTKLAIARKVANSIQQHLNQEKLVPVDHTKIKVTVSIGVVEVRSTDLSIDKLVKRADDLLYKAKKTGKNKVISSSK